MSGDDESVTISAETSILVRGSDDGGTRLSVVADRRAQREDAEYIMLRMHVSDRGWFTPDALRELGQRMVDMADREQPPTGDPWSAPGPDPLGPRPTPGV